MLNKRVSSLLKIVSILLFAFILFYIVTVLLRRNIAFQIIFYITGLIYYYIIDRNRFYSAIGFFKFLFIIILAFEVLLLPRVFLDISFTPFTIDVNSLSTLTDHYKNNWQTLIISFFLLPNIISLSDIFIRQITMIDIIIASNGNNFMKLIYLVIISGIEVMDRLRIYFKFHPDNYKKGIKNISHYIAVPLAMFFGIMKKFEYKLNSLEEREKILRREHE